MSRSAGNPSSQRYLSSSWSGEDEDNNHQRFIKTQEHIENFASKLETFQRYAEALTDRFKSFNTSDQSIYGTMRNTDELWNDIQALPKGSSERCRLACKLGPLLSGIEKQLVEREERSRKLLMYNDRLQREYGDLQTMLRQMTQDLPTPDSVKQSHSAVRNRVAEMYDKSAADTARASSKSSTSAATPISPRSALSPRSTDRFTERSSRDLLGREGPSLRRETSSSVASTRTSRPHSPIRARSSLGGA
jgi:hypothetical protein